MAQMPRMGPDPFSWAQDYNRQMTSLGAQSETNTQNTLMSMFQAEAARQRPWSDLPVNLAMQEKQYKLAQENQQAVARTQGAIKMAQEAQKAETKRMNMPVSDISRMIEKAAMGMGEDPDLALAIAMYESKLDPSAVSPTGATGLVQFTKGTGRRYGLINDAGDNRRDPQKNIEAGIRYWGDIKNHLARNGINVPTGRDAVRYVFLSHNQGEQGGLSLLRAYETDPSAPANKYADVGNLRVNNWRPGMSVKQFVDMHTQSVMNYYDNFARQRAARKSRGSENENFEERLNAVTKAVTAPTGEEIEIID